jgi:O-acetylserine/cysteine efflux transporter
MPLSLTHFLLALVVVAIWGTNFVVIRFGLDEFPPLLFAALRFSLAFLPAALLLPRPKVPLSYLAAYGLFIGVGQFGLIYIALDGLISPGLGSLVIQTQVFFTIGLTLWLHGQTVRPYQLAGLVLASAGIVVILAHTSPDATALGVAIFLLAALGWSGGNVVALKTPGVNMLAYVVWSSAFAVPPLFLMAWWLEGLPAMGHAVAAADLTGWVSLLWQTVGNTLFGYAVWAWLMARYPAATITPMALLVPVFGMGASAVVLGEAMPAWKLIAAGLVIAGLALNLLWPKVAAALRPSSSAV